MHHMSLHATKRYTRLCLARREARPLGPHGWFGIDDDRTGDSLGVSSVADDSTQHAEARIDDGRAPESSDERVRRAALRAERASEVVAGAAVDPPGDEPPSLSAEPSAAALAEVEERGSLEGLEELVPEADPLIGTLVAERYRVTELVGRGGMGAVYRAEHVHMRKTVALKVLHREMTAMDEVVARFEREAVAAGRIEHPNVVQARDFGRLPDGAFYLVLEYVEGEVLDRILKRAGATFSVERVLNIVGQIAEALHAAHEQNIVHRDLKPDNVMLIDRGAEPELVKVLDFGIAKMSIHERADKDRPITRAGTVFGTPEYMSPEQAAGQTVDHRSDLYSLGLLMYRMLAGHPPFTGGEVQAVLMMQITQPHPPIERALPLSVVELVDRLLVKDPEQRIQSAAEVLDSVLEVLDADLTPSHSRTRAKLASISQTDMTRPSLAERLDASSLGRAIPIGRQRVRAWRLSLVAGGALLIGVVAVLAVFTRPEAKLVETPPIAVAVAQPAPVVTPPLPVIDVDPELERLLGRALVGEKEAVEELKQRPKDERSVREWLALARGLVKNNKLGEALLAYKVALEKQPAVAEDSVLRRDVWRASQNPDTVMLALDLAANHLGAQGADMLYKIWVDTRDVTPATRRARELVYRPDVRSAASPALQFLLSWREAIGCDDYNRLLPQAGLHADRRALTLLKRAELSTDCKLPEESLKAAVLAARDRPQPAPY